MKMTAKRARKDSTKTQTEAIQAAVADVLPVPQGVTLRKIDAPFWKAITEARPRSTWTDIDLTHAATLARTMADMEVLQGEIYKAGYTFGDSVNPAFKVLETLSRRAIALSRMIHVHTLATVGRSGDAAGLAELERQAREAAAQDDGLIPMGPMQ